MITRAWVQWLRFVDDQSFLERDQTFDLQVASFAEQIRPRGERDARFDRHCFLPSGMFEQPMQPRALFGATVLGVERRLNT